MTKKDVDIITFDNEKMTVNKFQNHLTEWLNKT